MMINNLKKNQIIDIDLGDSARQRLVCGLRWDPTDVPDYLQNASNTNTDLDLFCVLMGKAGEDLGAVTGEEGHHSGDHGNIYHTGDVLDGADSHDDEQLNFELFNLSQNIHYIFLVAEIQTSHTFDTTNNPQIRIANAVTDEDMARIHLGHDEGGEKNAFIFGVLFRHETGWKMRYIGDYLDGRDVRDWSLHLSDYLDISAEERARSQANKPIVPERGKAVPLAYSKEARHRILCGLSWDPATYDVGTIEKLQNMNRNIETYDLDLSCVMFNSAGDAIDGVSPRPDETIDSTGKIYHTGDDTSGEGDGDDEAISVELRDLPEDIAHIIMIVEIQSEHTFDAVNNPEIRIADGKTNRTQMAVSLKTDQSKGKNAYIFARISRTPDGWMLHFIDEYATGADIPDWMAYLKRYLG